MLIASGGLSALPVDSVGGTALLFLGLFAASFFFSGTETAFFSLQERERRRIEEGETATDRRIRALLGSRASLITTILMGNETANVLISATAAGLIAALAPEWPWLSVVVVTPALVLFSEITPKVIALRFNRRWVQVAVWPISAIAFLLAIPRVIVTTIVQLLTRLLGVTARPEHTGLGEEEFLVLVEQSAAQGVVHHDAANIIEAVFELDDLPVNRLMTPRPDVFSLDIETPWTELLAACQEARYSRVPLWEESPDNIVGVLLIKDLLRHRRQPLQGADALRPLLLAPVVVPGSKPASEMMREMIRKRLHMAFVADEHGTIIGLVSLDDLIVELVGELGEDDDETSAEIAQADGGLVVSGAVDLEDFTEQTKISVPEGEYHTLGGYVFHTLGREPRVGDTVQDDVHQYEVVEMDGRRVSLVRITPLDALQEAG